MGNSAKRDTRKADRAERRRKALELRKAGASYEQIATQLGYTNKGSVWRDVRDAIADIYREPAMDVRQLELGRLDAMLLGVWQKAKAGDPHAIDRVIRIQERRSAYEGLDMPRALKVEVARELDSNLEKLKAGLDPHVYEQVLGVLAGEHGAAAAGPDPVGATERHDREPDEPG
jgi:hypothetical protein